MSPSSSPHLAFRSKHKDTTSQKISGDSINKFPRTHITNKLFLPFADCVEPTNL